MPGDPSWATPGALQTVCPWFLGGPAGRGELHARPGGWGGRGQHWAQCTCVEQAHGQVTMSERPVTTRVDRDLDQPHLLLSQCVSSRGGSGGGVVPLGLKTWNKAGEGGRDPSEGSCGLGVHPAVRHWGGCCFNVADWCGINSGSVSVRF